MISGTSVVAMGFQDGPPPGDVVRTARALSRHGR
jgi:hypothetical protein